MDSFSWNKSHWFIDKVMIQYPVRRVPWFGKTINNNEENPQKAVSSQRKLKIVISQSLNRPIVKEVIPQSPNHKSKPLCALCEALRVLRGLKTPDTCCFLHFYFVYLQPDIVLFFDMQWVILKLKYNP